MHGSGPMAKPLRTAEHLKGIDERLDRFEARVDERFAHVDKRFEQLDQRFDAMDKRFDAMDKRFDAMDKQFDDQRSHFDTFPEASSDRFNNLYDLMTAQGEKTEERFNKLEAELRLGMTDVKAALQTLLAGQTVRRRQKRIS